MVLATATVTRLGFVPAVWFGTPLEFFSVAGIPAGKTLTVTEPTGTLSAVYEPSGLVVTVVLNEPLVRVTWTPPKPFSPAPWLPLPLLSTKTVPRRLPVKTKPTLVVVLLPGTTFTACGLLAVVRLELVGVVTVAVVLPNGKLGTLYVPFGWVLTTIGAPPPAGVIVTGTPPIPSSPGSWIPLLFLSSNTKPVSVPVVTGEIGVGVLGSPFGVVGKLELLLLVSVASEPVGGTAGWAGSFGTVCPRFGPVAIVLAKTLFWRAWVAVATSGKPTVTVN